MTQPHSDIFDDIYFAAEDGLSESRYVFLQQNNLPAAWEHRQNFTICETGFGTGLNFLCAWDLFAKTAQKSAKLSYISFEKYPLSPTEIRQYLTPWQDQLGRNLDLLCASYPPRIGGWHHIALTPQIDLLLIFDDVNRAIPELDETITKVDCWFLDGHAPAKNPDMWSDILFENMARLSNPKASFATFTAAGVVKNGLRRHGFEVIKARGFGRKRDMIKGHFEGGFVAQHSRASAAQNSLPNVCPASSVQSVAIIGGGLAGASTAYELLKHGIAVDLYERAGLGAGASGNLLGLYNPRLTARRGFESDFYSPAFAHSLKLFKQAIEGASERESLKLSFGNLHLSNAGDHLSDAGQEKRDHRLSSFRQEWAWHSDHAVMVNAEEASDIAGVRMISGGVFLPDAGSISPYNFVQFLLRPHPQLSVRMEPVLKLIPQGNKWSVGGKIYDAVILACAAEASKFFNASYLPLQTVRGQISLIKAPDVFENLAVNLCYGGYASKPFTENAARNMVVGSTFEPWDEGVDVRAQDHDFVLQKLSQQIPQFDGTAEILGGRAALRCSTKDRIPLIGELPHFPRLYVSLAHGSHGLITARLAAKILASLCTSGPQILPKSVLRKLSPSRIIKPDQPANLINYSVSVDKDL